MDRINKQLAISKNLIVNDDDTKYKNLVKIYKYLLEYYLSSKIDLSKYDSMIKNSNLYIGNNSKFKSLNEYLNLDYIFLINNIYVEKLSIDDINLLFQKFNKDNLDNELIDIVSRTYKDVILDNYLDNDYSNDRYKVCYGLFVPNNIVYNDSLVLKLYYGKNLVEVNGTDFIELHKKQLSFLENIINDIKKEINEKLEINCEVLIEKDIY